MSGNNNYNEPYIAVKRVSTFNYGRIFLDDHSTALALYPFISKAAEMGLKYDELSDEAEKHYGKEETKTNYFGRIITAYNYLGLLELDSEDKVIKNDLLEFLYNEIAEKGNEKLGVLYMNYFLSYWQVPLPFHDDNDIEYTKPYLLILKILLELYNESPNKFYLTGSEYYQLFKEQIITEVDEIDAN
ncbi:MAG: hypothetical protein ACOCRK_09325, partial [bacterium]